MTDEPERDSSEETKTQRNAILTDQNPLSIVERLPPCVFPVECRFGISRERTRDRRDAEYRSPTYPVSLHESEGVYVPETTVHFDNPIRRPPDGAVAWSPDDFVTQLEEFLDEGADAISVEDISLQRFTVVEVPQHLIKTDSQTGEPAVKPELYKDEAQMVLARFQKHGSLAASAVRNQIDEALPGESRTPARLTDLLEVTAKPSRHGRQTTATAGRDRYYTEDEAERVEELDKTPAHYQLRSLPEPSERTRPLIPVLQSLDDFLPEIVKQTDELVKTVEFVGYEETKLSFVATEVRE